MATSRRSFSTRAVIIINCMFHESDCISLRITSTESATIELSVFHFNNFHKISSVASHSKTRRCSKKFLRDDCFLSQCFVSKLCFQVDYSSVSKMLFLSYVSKLTITYFNIKRKKIGLRWFIMLGFNEFHCF